MGFDFSKSDATDTTLPDESTGNEESKNNLKS